MSGLPEFLLARIAEREAQARAVQQAEGPWLAGATAPHLVDTVVYRPSTWHGHITHVCNTEYAGDDAAALAEFIAANDPARVLAECEAKRRIVEQHPSAGLLAFPEMCGRCVTNPPAPCPTLRLLALPYADHPDYRQEWKP